MRLASPCQQHLWIADGASPLPRTGAQQKQRAISNWQRVLRALQAPWSNWTDLAAYYTAEMPTPHTAAPSSSALASAAPIPDAAAASTFTMPPDLRPQLHLEGFAVARRCGRPVDVATLEKSLYVSNSAFEPDGAITIRREEADRRTFSIRPPYLKELTQELRGDLVQHNLAGGRDLLEMRAIVSEPNGVAATTEQEVHCDDEDPDHEVYRKYYLADDVLLAGVCAVMPGTKLVLYPRGKDGPRIELDLDVGDILVFRGDCYHCGAKYSKRNMRLHFYFSSKKRRRTRTQLVLLELCKGR